MKKIFFALIAVSGLILGSCSESTDVKDNIEETTDVVNNENGSGDSEEKKGCCSKDKDSSCEKTKCAEDKNEESCAKDCDSTKCDKTDVVSVSCSKECDKTKCNKETKVCSEGCSKDCCA